MVGASTSVPMVSLSNTVSRHGIFQTLGPTLNRHFMGPLINNHYLGKISVECLCCTQIPKIILT